ncbi:Chitin binding domain and EB domain and Cysteine-rich repeat-containing protein [Strongyloides ratti]|uniref:Chitin binding domain and EB domain and Cysteine-rich repeat-containing protein n=1 Tax=Strongyloides ratti TaxID=34506 RepID=A0A090MVV6_STRRB|nr:Chitin binding domain and EB domain and Cysteine-rich repeat-containing protein [Strongyloides ratti]CEF63148.1 Chitin binding domain and EB domain and Cysteine-rich repeat-containing protein [Strongyloides ratti]
MVATNYFKLKNIGTRLLLLLFLLYSIKGDDSLSLDLIDGRVCMTVEHSRSSRNSSSYFECVPLSDNENEQYRIKGKYLGIWTLKKCSKNFYFDEPQQKCIERRKVHRQPSMDENVECQASNANPIEGGECNWLTATLQSDPYSRNHFLQCSITNPGEYCGEWIRMPCAPGTIFEFTQQICVAEEVDNSNECGKNTGSPICPCSGSSGTCPGISICISSICCQQQQIDPSMQMFQNAPFFQQSLCIGTGAKPIGPCQLNSCPNNYECQDGIGCCPTVPFESTGNLVSISVKVCPGSSIVPIGTCTNGNGCPSGTVCNEKVNGCCPQLEDKKFTVIMLCPNGKPAVGPCNSNNLCSQGQSCFKGACCQLSTCPIGQQPQGFCNSGSCNNGGTCHQSTCCQSVEVIKLPICSNGQASTVPCTMSNQCGPGFECSNGGCCPVPFCPNGIQAISRCNGPCGTGLTCLEGLCCPLPKCPSGELANTMCTQNRDCGIGSDCVNNGCCPMPQCPSGNFASCRCGSQVGGKSCPLGQACINGGCCMLPLCPNGIQAVSLCTASFQCGIGMECVNSGCCALPTCSNGKAASERCQMGSCPPNKLCENGVCCDIPVCSTTGMIPAQFCGIGNSCPLNFYCERQGCCPEPLPLCPNGGRSTSRCDRGSDCPPGFGCTSLGGCCRLSVEPICPLRMNAICQCSANNGCPQGSTCNQGTCCTQVSATFNQVPGTSCQMSTQCNGFTNSNSRCLQNTCICTKGAISNGASCIQQPAIVVNQARNGCDQYGNPCKFVLSTTRRRPLFTPVGNVTDTPLWFNVIELRSCIDDPTITGVDFDPDSTCLPNEKCINGKCRTKLWPGEYGCNSDMECQARCPNTYCEQKTDKNVPQCLCKNGFLLYGRCVENCPSGFHSSDKYCMHNDEDHFWKDSKLQDNLRELLNKGNC